MGPPLKQRGNMRTEIKYERQFSRDGTWWRCGAGSTLEKCHDSAMRYAGMQPKGDNFYSLPKRTLKITTEVKTEIVEES